MFLWFFTHTLQLIRPSRILLNSIYKWPVLCGVPCVISNSYPCDISLSCYVYSSAVSGMTDFMSDLASNQSLVSTISSDYHGYLGLLKKHADDKKPTTPTSRRSSLSSKQTAAKNKQLKGLAKMVVMFK